MVSLGAHNGNRQSGKVLEECKLRGGVFFLGRSDVFAGGGGADNVLFTTTNDHYSDTLVTYQLLLL